MKLTEIENGNLYTVKQADGTSMNFTALAEAIHYVNTTSKLYKNDRLVTEDFVSGALKAAGYAHDMFGKGDNVYRNALNNRNNAVDARERGTRTFDWDAESETLTISTPNKPEQYFTVDNEGNWHADTDADGIYDNKIDDPHVVKDLETGKNIAIANAAHAEKLRKKEEEKNKKPEDKNTAKLQSAEAKFANRPVTLPADKNGAVYTRDKTGAWSKDGEHVTDIAIVNVLNDYSIKYLQNQQNTARQQDLANNPSATPKQKKPKKLKTATGKVYYKMPNGGWTEDPTSGSNIMDKNLIDQLNQLAQSKSRK